MEAEIPLESRPYPAVKSADRLKSENNPEPHTLPFRGPDNVVTFRDLVPQGMLAAVELIRLSRPDLQRLVVFITKKSYTRYTYELVVSSMLVSTVTS